MTEYPATRSAGLERLRAFVPHAGRDYAARRNYDLPDHPHVSQLSPYIRHRLITEDEVLAAVLGRHSPGAAEKFVQEVLWRTYWKGWLEMRPGVWADYKRGRGVAWNRVQTESGLRAEWDAACKGETGIDAFDHWAHQLAATGYLHNHARMWFASIWIFTLRLPWQLGADFFLRHLLDGDPASNTLSWRWVAGLQTQGKHYLARASNIAKYTDGRFSPQHRLDTGAAPLEGPPHPERRPLDGPPAPDPARRTALIVTEDDLSPGWALGPIRPVAAAILNGAPGRSHLAIAPQVAAFTASAIDDCIARHGETLQGAARLAAGDALEDDFKSWLQSHDIEQIIMPHAPVGPAADALAQLGPALKAQGVRLAVRRRDLDTLAWPHATAGFFKFKKQIPNLLDALGLAA